MTPRLSAVVVLAVVVVAAGLVALTRAPRRRPPAPRADQRAALASLPADAVARGRAFHRALRPPGYAARVLSLVVVLLLGLTPLAARIVALVGGHWAVRAVLGGLIVVFLAGLVTLPLAGWREVVMRRYGLSTRSWRGWLVDVLKGYAVGAVLGAVALLGFYAVARYTGQWWWVWAALGAAALTVLLSFVFPVLVEPVFNKFTPMADGPLRSALLDLAARDRVPVRDVLVADASRRTRAVNAYVSGLGPTRRIEARADAHALALTDDPATFEAMEARLATVNLADPDPPRWEHLLFASHPATVERMAAARAYARGQR